MNEDEEMPEDEYLAWIEKQIAAAEHEQKAGK